MVTQRRRKSYPNFLNESLQSELRIKYCLKEVLLVDDGIENKLGS